MNPSPFFILIFCRSDFRSRYLSTVAGEVPNLADKEPTHESHER
jgi:hypothetical protein